LFVLASGSFNLLEVHPGLVIWTLVTFLLVVGILKKFAWDTILHALDARAEKVEGDIKKAESTRAEAEKVLHDYKAKIQSSKDEADKIIAEAKKDGEVLTKRSLVMLTRKLLPSRNKRLVISSSPKRKPCRKSNLTSLR